MLIAILGRQPEISLAELESYFGSDQVRVLSPIAAIIEADTANIDDFGGILKFVQVDLKTYPKSQTEISKQIINFYDRELPTDQGKLTIGVSWYQKDAKPSLANSLGLKIKSKLKNHKLSVRLIPNAQSAVLSTATSHHNQLGLNNKHIEIIICATSDVIFVGRSLGAQNISAYRDRDQARPKRDARVGMLPPKLAQVMLNLAIKPGAMRQRVLDPFCGTGVILQETWLMGHQPIGSDKEPRMIDYTRTNLEWLGMKDEQIQLNIGDATNYQWEQPIDAIVSETYLGRLFSNIPTQNQLLDEQHLVENLIRGFLKNISPQIETGTRLCLAVPAWLRADNSYHDLNLSIASNLLNLGYKPIAFKNIKSGGLLYHRPEQIVARRLLVLEKIDQS